MKTLLLDRDGGIAHVTLNRPDKKNAMSLEMMSELAEVGQALAGDAGLRAVILSGAEQCFCAGIDLQDLLGLAGQKEKITQMLETEIAPGLGNHFQAPCTVWRRLRVPVIAALEGVAFGAGVQLALGADFRIASPEAQLSLMEGKWGIIPDMGATEVLPSLMRYDQALDLMMSARIIGATEAERLGLVTKTAVDPLAAAREMALALVQMAPNTVAAAKELAQKAWGQSEAALAQEAALQEQLIGTPQQMEKAMASFQKRAPIFD